LVVWLVAVFDGYKGIDCLASKLIADTDDCCFGNGVVLNECSLDFGSGETMT